MRFLSKAWDNLNRATIGTDIYWSIAVQNLSIYNDTKNLIKKHITGKTLDIGAGNLAWKNVLAAEAGSYESADYAVVNPKLDLVFDVTKPFPLKDETYDSLFCHSVLEHTITPWKTFSEFYRILKHDSVLLLSVPFIFYLHGAPHDYYRFTKYGILHLAKEAGFSVDHMKLSGGIFHFILNMPSVVISSILHVLHLSPFIPITTNVLLQLSRQLDNLFDKDGLFAMNIVVVLRKK